jgi:hypothetical protein
MRVTRLSVTLAALLAAAGCVHAEGTNRPAEQKPAEQQPAVQPPAGQKPAVQEPVNEARPLSTADARALADFKARVDQYVRQHQKVEAMLPKKPTETTPAVIDSHQRALEKLLRAERRDAKPGNILTPEVRRIFRQLLVRVFSGQAGQEMKATILDENPGKIALQINGRYPDDVPLSTVPPQVLSSLPKLPEELEYRFVGERLVLLDVHAHTIVDYMDNAFPR